jgi:hypothetical protein
VRITQKYIRKILFANNKLSSSLTVYNSLQSKKLTFKIILVTLAASEKAAFLR